MPIAGRVESLKSAASMTVSALKSVMSACAPCCEHAAAFEPERRRGESGHLVDRGLKGKKLQVARVMPEHARESAPQPRMRLRVVRQPVGADHRVVELQYALHVLLVEHEVDRAGRLDRLHRFGLAHAQTFRDLVQVDSRELRMRFRPRHDDARRLLRAGRSAALSTTRCRDSSRAPPAAPCVCARSAPASRASGRDCACRRTCGAR